jgi:hypothetical protein
MRIYSEDREAVDTFETQIKRVCGEIFIKTASKKIDCEEATDLIVMELEPIRIACRLRNLYYYEKYPFDFTVRFTRPSGNKSEYEKIMDGWCDYNFYGFHSDNTIISWFIGDLNVFRKELTNEAIGESNISYTKSYNKDNSSTFLAFDRRTFPKEFIIASGGTQ